MTPHSVVTTVTLLIWVSEIVFHETIYLLTEIGDTAVTVADGGALACYSVTATPAATAQEGRGTHVSILPTANADFQ